MIAIFSPYPKKEVCFHRSDQVFFFSFFCFLCFPPLSPPLPFLSSLTLFNPRSHMNGWRSIDLRSLLGLNVLVGLILHGGSSLVVITFLCILSLLPFLRFWAIAFFYRVFFFFFFFFYLFLLSLSIPQSGNVDVSVTEVWSQPHPTNIAYLSASPDSRYLVTHSQHSRFAKVWFQSRGRYIPSDEGSTQPWGFSFFFLSLSLFFSFLWFILFSFVFPFSCPLPFPFPFPFPLSPSSFPPPSFVLHLLTTKIRVPKYHVKTSKSSGKCSQMAFFSHCHQVFFFLFLSPLFPSFPLLLSSSL